MRNILKADANPARHGFSFLGHHDIQPLDSDTRGRAAGKPDFCMSQRAIISALSWRRTPRARPVIPAKAGMTDEFRPKTPYFVQRTRVWIEILCNWQVNLWSIASVVSASKIDDYVSSEFQPCDLCSGSDNSFLELIVEVCGQEPVVGKLFAVFPQVGPVRIELFAALRHVAAFPASTLRVSIKALKEGGICSLEFAQHDGRRLVGIHVAELLAQYDKRSATRSLCTRRNRDLLIRRW